MANVNIPFLIVKKNKNGSVNCYWQPSKTLADAGFKSQPLGHDEVAAIAAAQEINAQVDEWRKGALVPQVNHHRKQGTLGALIQRYRSEVVNGRKEDGTPRLAQGTKGIYETNLKRLEAWAGDEPLSYITPLRIRVLREKNARPREDGGLGHAAAFNLLKQLRQVMEFAEEIELIAKGANPAKKFNLGPPPARKQIWEADDEAAFCAAAIDMGYPGMALAMELAIYSAQREGDLIAFTEAQFKDMDLFDPTLRQLLAGDDGKVMGWELVQGKTLHQLSIPLEPGIRAKVERAIRNNRARDRAADPPRLLTHVLVNDRTGEPWKRRHFVRKWREVIDHAVERTGRDHMRDLVWHDLRRTRVVRLRRRAMPKEMIASITGHSLAAIEAMLKVYGPIDATITAAAIASSLERKEA